MVVGFTFVKVQIIQKRTQLEFILFCYRKEVGDIPQM